MSSECADLFSLGRNDSEEAHKFAKLLSWIQLLSTGISSVVKEGKNYLKKKVSFVPKWYMWGSKGGKEMAYREKNAEKLLGWSFISNRKALQ